MASGISQHDSGQEPAPATFPLVNLVKAPVPEVEYRHQIDFGSLSFAAKP